MGLPWWARPPAQHDAADHGGEEQGQEYGKVWGSGMVLLMATTAADDELGGKARDGDAAGDHARHGAGHSHR